MQGVLLNLLITCCWRRDFIWYQRMQDYVRAVEGVQVKLGLDLEERRQDFLFSEWKLSAKSKFLHLL